MKRLIVTVIGVVTFISVLSALPALGVAVEVTIKEGTPVPVRVDQTVSSESAMLGQSVKCFVTRDVVVGKFTVIKAGSEVFTEVTHSQRTASLGKEGEVCIVVRNTFAVDDTIVPLRATLAQAGNENVALSLMVCPLIRGTSSMIPSGTETKGYVKSDINVQLDLIKENDVD